MANQHPMAEKLPSNAHHAAPTAWEEVRGVLEGETWYWLTTERPDSRSHVCPVLTVSLDGAAYFCSNECTRKGKNRQIATGGGRLCHQV
jgi:hypothetical protein